GGAGGNRRRAGHVPAGREAAPGPQAGLPRHGGGQGGRHGGRDAGHHGRGDRPRPRRRTGGQARSEEVSGTRTGRPRSAPGAVAAGPARLAGPTPTPSPLLSTGTRLGGAKKWFHNLWSGHSVTGRPRSRSDRTTV